MDQIGKLKALICQLIDDNQFLVSMLNSMKQRGDNLPQIELTYLKGSFFCPDTNCIKISIPDITYSYRLAKLCINDENSSSTIKPIYLNNHFHCESFWEISVKLSKAEEIIIEEEIRKTNFLRGDKANIIGFDALTQFSIAYSLYHEIGHAFHNKYIPESEPIKREVAADSFAFEAIKSRCIIDNYDVLFRGTFIGVIQVLMRRKQIEEVADAEHPHSIERLYYLLNSWGIQYDSYYWKLSFLFFSRWCKWNHEPLDWLVESSATPYDKFMDAYSHYRKKDNKKSLCNI